MNRLSKSAGFTLIIRGYTRRYSLLPIPIDRILIAECAARGLSLVSRDGTIARYAGIQIIW